MSAPVDPAAARAEATPPVDESERTLVWRVCANAGRGRPRAPRWTHVKATTGVGSTTARAWCSRSNLDPDEEVGEEERQAPPVDLAALREAVERVDNEEQRRRTWPALWHLHKVAHAIVEAARALDTVAATASAFMTPAPAPAARKCPECNGYGDDGDAPCQVCGGTRLGPTPPPVADPGAVSEGDVATARAFVSRMQAAHGAIRTEFGSTGIDGLGAVARVVATPRVNESRVPCVECGGIIDWLDCPTGGWWSHRQHPADGHEADPPRNPPHTLGGDEDETPPVGLAALREAVRAWRPAYAQALRELPEKERAVIEAAVALVDATPADAAAVDRDELHDRGVMNAVLAIQGLDRLDADGMAVQARCVAEARTALARPSAPQEHVDLAALRAAWVAADRVVWDGEGEPDGTGDSDEIIITVAEWETMRRLVAEVANVVDATPADAAGPVQCVEGGCSAASEPGFRRCTPHRDQMHADYARRQRDRAADAAGPAPQEPAELVRAHEPGETGFCRRCGETIGTDTYRRGCPETSDEGGL